MDFGDARPMKIVGCSSRVEYKTLIGGVILAVEGCEPSPLRILSYFNLVRGSKTVATTRSGVETEVEAVIKRVR